MKKLLMLTVAGALFVCGCGPGYNFSPFMGQQQNWVTSPGGFSRVVDKVVVFSPGQYPNRPYMILGTVTTDSEGNLAKAARQQGADAALISNERTYRTGTVAIAGPGVIFDQPLRKTEITGNLIKFR